MTTRNFVDSFLFRREKKERPKATALAVWPTIDARTISTGFKDDT